MDVEQEARALVMAHGWRTRQIVADRVVAAIRLGDLAEAKEWDEVGAAADRLLSQEAARP
jgi:hypothetical protein